jgi:MFS family permease
MHPASLQSFEAIAFYYARAWFGCAVHPLVENAIANLSATQLHLLSRTSMTGLENMFRKNKDSVWLHMTFLTSVRDRGTILKRAFIPASVSSIDSPAVLTRNKRRVQSTGSRWRQYIAYLISRCGTYVYADLTALWHGLCWRLSRHQLSSQFWIFLAASFFFDLGFSIYYFLINLFLVDRGYNESSLGIFTSAMVIGSLAGALPWGRLSQRVGLRPVLLVCFALAILISSMRTLLLSFSSQLVLAFLAGVTMSAWAVCLAPAVAQLTEDKQRPFAFSLIFSLGIGIGALGGFAGSHFPQWFSNHNLHIGTLFPEQLVLLLSCAIVALGIWPVTKLAFIRPQVTEKPRARLSPFLLRFLPAIAVWSLVTGSFSPLSSVYLARHVHLSLPQIGNAFSLAQIVQVVAVLLAPVLFRRWGLIGGIVSTQVAASALLLVLASTATPLAAITAYICFSAVQWMNEPGLYSLLMNMVPAADRSGASASNSLVGSASLAIAATLAGRAFVHYGYPAALRGIAIIALLAASLFWNLQGHAQRGSAPVLNDAAS